jgi:hypothetical protein
VYLAMEVIVDLLEIIELEKNASRAPTNEDRIPWSFGYVENTEETTRP